MTRLKRTDSIVAVFWMALGVTISIWSATFPLGSWEAIGPAVLPLACGLVLLLLGMILFVQACKRREEGARRNGLLIPRGDAFRRVALSLGGLLLSAIFFDLLGFLLTFFLLILFLMKTLQPLNWRVPVFYALVLTLGSYLFFKVLLKVTVPHGWIGF